MEQKSKYFFSVKESSEFRFRYDMLRIQTDSFPRQLADPCVYFGHIYDWVFLIFHKTMSMLSAINGVPRSTGASSEFDRWSKNKLMFFSCLLCVGVPTAYLWRCILE